MLKQSARSLLLIGFLTAGAYLQTLWLVDGKLFEPIYSYDDEADLPDFGHRLRSPYEDDLSVVVTTQKTSEPVANVSSRSPLDKSPVEIESINTSVASIGEVRSEQKEDAGRHMSGLVNYYHRLRSSALAQSTKYDFLADQQLSENLLHQRNEELGHLASLVLSSRQVRSKKDEVMTVASVELKPRAEEMSHKWSLAEGDIQRQTRVEVMHKRHVLFVEDRRLHQLSMFGEEVDLDELLKQEADAMACGPRNCIRSNLNKQQFNEFPSHAGLYTMANANNNTANNLNFLCGATWFHERFVLTLASCLEKVELEQLIVRLGEWTVGRPIENTALVMSRVDRVFRFPGYMSNSSVPAHDLVLLRLDLPSSRLDYRRRMTYLTPVCLPDSLATTIQSLDCRAPQRRITTNEYLDLEGDGEMRMQHAVEMMEQPMELNCSHDPQLPQEIFVAADPICLSKLPPSDEDEQRELNGSGVYCNESGLLRLRAIVQQHEKLINLIDLTFYLPWLRNITLGNN